MKILLLALTLCLSHAHALDYSFDANVPAGYRAEVKAILSTGHEVKSGGVKFAWVRGGNVGQTAIGAASTPLVINEVDKGSEAVAWTFENTISLNSAHKYKFNEMKAVLQREIAGFK